MGHDGVVDVNFEARPEGLWVQFLFGIGGADRSGRPERLFSWLWVRDHGEDPDSQDVATGQRLVDTFRIAEAPAPAKVSLLDDTIQFQWADPDATTTLISVATLAQVSGASARADQRLAWTSGTCQDPSPTVLFRDLVQRPAAAAPNPHLAKAFGFLHEHGFLVVAGLSDELSDTHRLLDCFGGAMESAFGDVWTVASGSEKHADSAYTAVALEPHTDGSYCDEAPGYQLLHFTVAGVGGESILVDGMAVYEQLEAQHPEHVETLTSVNVPGHYTEPGVHLRTARPALRLDSDRNLIQISFNNYDRAPMWLPPQEMAAFYDAYRALHDRIIDPQNRITWRLEPGEALIFNNWRLLHGRAVFSGQRCFQGGYLSQENVQSRSFAQ